MVLRLNGVRHWSCAALVCTALFGLGVVGCTQKVEMKKVDLKSGTSSDDEQKIKGYLEAAGIKGDVVAITSDAKSWIVSVNAPRTGGKQMPVPPNDYLIDKASGKVTAGQVPGAM